PPMASPPPPPRPYRPRTTLSRHDALPISRALGTDSTADVDADRSFQDLGFRSDDHTSDRHSPSSGA
ncbi:hypothetical protein PJL08_29135, partial [Mycobacterium kansasii]